MITTLSAFVTSRAHAGFAHWDSLAFRSWYALHNMRWHRNIHRGLIASSFKDSARFHGMGRNTYKMNYSFLRELFETDILIVVISEAYKRIYK